MTISTCTTGYYVTMGRRPIYKFINPCEHPLYQPGDSWTEKMEWSEDEFDSALKRIATKVKASDIDKVLQVKVPEFGPNADKRCKQRMVLTNSQFLVAYFRDASNTTRYLLNEELLINAVQMAMRLEYSKREISAQQTVISGVATGDIPATFNTESFKEDNTDSIESLTMPLSRIVTTAASGSESISGPCNLSEEKEKDRYDMDVKDAVVEEENSDENSDRAENYLQTRELVAELWGISSPALINRITDTVLGLHQSGTLYYESNVNPPVILR